MRLPLMLVLVILERSGQVGTQHDKVFVLSGVDDPEQHIPHRSRRSLIFLHSYVRLWELLP